MRYWVFHADMLAAALAAFEARRQQEGATEQQAKDDTAVIIAFLESPEARDRNMFNRGGKG
jgi:hypothetical protein